MRAHPLPKKVWLGPHYYVKIIVTSQKAIQELPSVLAQTESGEDAGIFEGYWDPDITDGDACMGAVYVWNKMTARKRWESFRHEMIHVINDVDDWVKQNGI